MSHAFDVTTARAPARAWAVGPLLALMVVATSTGCLRLDPDHCMINGGDLACGGDFCVIGTGARPELMDDGCIDAVGYVPSGFVHVEYGIPSRLGGSDDVDDLDSVAGVVATAAQHDGSSVACATAETSLAVLLEPWVGAAVIRGHLERPDHVRKQAVVLDQTQAEAIYMFNQAVGQVIANCTYTASDAASSTEADEPLIGDDSDDTMDSASSGSSG